MFIHSFIPNLQDFLQFQVSEYEIVVDAHEESLDEFVIVTEK